MTTIILAYLVLIQLKGCFCSINATKWSVRFDANDPDKWAGIKVNPRFHPLTGRFESRVERVFSESAVQRDYMPFDPTKFLPQPADSALIAFNIMTLFSTPRHDSNPLLKRDAQQKIIAALLDYGLDIETQSFKAKLQPNWEAGGFTEGMNIIGVLPGKHRNKPGDKLLVVGAHYDTVNISSGVDDNGSGLAAILEIARLLHPYKGSLNCTILFVFFDFEEVGLQGSIAFTSHYLLPREMGDKRGLFLGAFITDMLLYFDDERDVQQLPDGLRPYFPEAEAWLKRNSRRGDFLGIWSRRYIDTHLYHKFRRTWDQLGDGSFKLLALEPLLPVSSPSLEDRQRMGTFFRSDHASFWFPRVFEFKSTLPAILLSDWGPWRGRMKACYHQRCDDLSFLTPKNLKFLKHTVDTLTRVLFDFSA